MAGGYGTPKDPRLDPNTHGDPSQVGAGPPVRGTDPTGSGLAGAAGITNNAVAGGVQPDAYSLGGKGAGGAQDIINGYNNSANAADGRSGAQINLGGNYGADRGAQSGLMGSYMGVVNGTGGPSAAEMGRQQANSQAMSNVNSMAASARGGPAAQAAAMRTAMQSGGQTMADNAQNGAMLHANEVNQARAGAAGLANNMAGTSAGLANAQGQLDNSRLQQNDARNMGYAQLGMQGQLAQQQGAEHAGDQNQAAQALNVQTAGHNADKNKGLLDSAVGGIGSAVGAIGSLFSDEDLKMNISPMSDDQELNGLPDNSGMAGASKYKDSSGGGYGSTKSDPATKAAVTHEMLNNSLTPDATTKRGIGSLGGQATYDDGIKADKYASQTAKLISSGDAKQGVKPGGIRQALDKMKAVSFEYKDQALGAGRRAGIIAQDMEKSPAGAAVVEETPAGKAIDIPKATGFNLAASTDLHHRVKALEQKSVAPIQKTLNKDYNEAASKLAASPARNLPKGVEETSTQVDPTKQDGPAGERQHDRYIAYHEAKKSGDLAQARRIKADFVAEHDPEEAAAMRKNDAELTRLMKARKPALVEVAE